VDGFKVNIQRKEENEMAKKILALLTLVLLVAGCGPAATATTAPVATSAPVPTAEPTKGPPVMLDYYQEGNQDSTKRAAVEAAINAYIEPLINAHVTFHIIPWVDWAGKAVTALEAGQKADIFFTADWNGYMQEVTEGLLTPMNDPKGPNGNLIEQYGKGITSTLNPAFITGSQVNGVTYAIPTQKELSVPWGFVYNATIADEIGFTDADAAAVKTMADLEPWIAKAKAKHPDMYPYLTDGTIGFMQWVHGFTGLSDYVVNMSALPDASGKVDETIMDPVETPWMADYLNTIRTWYTKGYINPDAGLTTFDTGSVLNAGNFFVEPMPLKGNNIKATELMISSGNAKLQLKEIYGMPKVVNTSDAGGSMLAIPTASTHPVEAMKFINLMHTDSTLINMMLYGVPNTMWTVEADGRVNIVDTAWISAMPGAWVFGDITLQKVSNKEDPAKNQKLIDYAKDAFLEPSLGFRFVPDPVNAEITAIQSVVDGSQRALLTGYVDPKTELPKFIQSLKDAGLAKVLAEVQKQYTAWKAAKAK
jgi:putative aldouronate transport system substrate-binding protein